jgi:hypothetical protein
MAAPTMLLENTHGENLDSAEAGKVRGSTDGENEGWVKKTKQGECRVVIKGERFKV